MRAAYGTLVKCGEGSTHLYVRLTCPFVTLDLPPGLSASLRRCAALNKVDRKITPLLRSGNSDGLDGQTLREVARVTGARSPSQSRGSYFSVHILIH